MRDEPTVNPVDLQLIMKQKDLSIFQLIWQDAVAFFSALFPVIIWVVFILITNSKGVGLSTPLIIVGVAITLASAGALIWRIMLFRAIFAENQEIPAKINQVSFYRDRGRVDFVYTYQGQKYISGSPIMKTRRTKALQAGEEVTVLVDSSQPKRAIIRKLYNRG